MADPVIETPEVEEFKLRVEKERDALAEKTQALRAFINTPGTLYESLPFNEKIRLSRQFSAMSIYLEAINDRIVADYL